MSLAYAFENRRINDGESAFGVDKTFRIGDTIYLLNEEAVVSLRTALEASDYVIEGDSQSVSWSAKRSHKIAPDEIIGELGVKAVAFPTSFIINAKYKDGHKHSLTEFDLYKTILSAASQRSDLEYYNRLGDTFSDDIVARMSAFVKNLVDVDFAEWEKFVADSNRLHAQDFIKSIAAWASRHSDQKTRYVRENTFVNHAINPNDKFSQRPPEFGMEYRY